MELATAMQERTDIIVVLNVNCCTRWIHGHQTALVGHSLGNELKVNDGRTGLADSGTFIEVDYVKNVGSVGTRTWLSETEDALRSALRKAGKEGRPRVIFVPTEFYGFPPDSCVWLEFVGAEVMNNRRTTRLMEERESGRAKRRFYS